MAANIDDNNTITIRVGIDDETLGTITATPGGLRVSGDTDQLNALIADFRSLRFYRGMSDEELLREIGRSLQGRTWAEVLSGGDETPATAGQEPQPAQQAQQQRG